MNKSGCKDPIAEKAVAKVDRENRIIRKCHHVQSVGPVAVYVDPGCRSANMIKGTLVSSRRRCLECMITTKRNELQQTVI